jgi:hypothetical protein
MRKLPIVLRQYALLILHLVDPYRKVYGWTTTTSTFILSKRRRITPFRRSDTVVAAKRRQRQGDSDQDGDMNRWYDAVDENASPDDVYWEEMQRQSLFAATNMAAQQQQLVDNGIPPMPGGNTLLGMGSEPQQPPPVFRPPPPSTPSNRGAAAASSATAGTGGRSLDNINLWQEQQQQMLISPGDEEKPIITPKAAEATLKEYAAYMITDNWLDDEIVEMIMNQQREDDNNLWDDDAPSLEEQMEAWDREGDDNDDDDDAEDDDDEYTDEPWDTWNNPRADETTPLLDETHPSLRHHILNVNNMHDADTADDIETERLWQERQNKITIASRRLERARDNPNAQSYFARPPDALQGYDQMWVAAIDPACFKNLRGVFRDYGVQFADNFGDYTDTTVADGLANIEDIASFKARQVYNITGLPCIASRTSFEVEPVWTGPRAGGTNMAAAGTATTTGPSMPPPSMMMMDRSSGSANAARSAATLMMSNPRVLSGYKFNDVGMHVEYIVEALRPFSEPSRVTRFKTCLCYYDGQVEFYEYGMVDCDMVFCNSLRTVRIIWFRTKTMCVLALHCRDNTSLTCHKTVFLRSSFPCRRPLTPCTRPANLPLDWNIKIGYTSVWTTCRTVAVVAVPVRPWSSCATGC